MYPDSSRVILSCDCVHVRDVRCLRGRHLVVLQNLLDLALTSRAPGSLEARVRGPVISLGEFHWPRVYSLSAGPSVPTNLAWADCWMGPLVRAKEVVTDLCNILLPKQSLCDDTALVSIVMGISDPYKIKEYRRQTLAPWQTAPSSAGFI